MSHLHTVNSSEQLSDCSKFLKEGDSLLLIEDGVYCVAAEEIDNLANAVSIYALRDDIHARGLTKVTGRQFKQISSNEFVNLCCDHPKIINWF